MLETKWIIFAGWSLLGIFLVGIGIGLSWGETAIMEAGSESSFGASRKRTNWHPVLLHKNPRERGDFRSDRRGIINTKEVYCNSRTPADHWPDRTSSNR
jgi:hypothetical protein